MYCYKQLDYNFKWYLPYFVFINIYELANFFDLLMIKHSNSWCNNLVGFMEFPIIIYFLTSFDRRPSYKKTVYILTVIIVLFSLADIFFIQGFWERDTIAIVIQALFVLALIFIYYRNLLEDAQEGLELIKSPPFLAITGWLFYFCAKVMFYVGFSYMIYKNNYHFYILAGTIPGLSNLLLNSILIYAFICSSKNKRAFGKEISTNKI